MKKQMRKILILISLVSLIALCGCGGDDEPKETPANTPAPSIELTAETLKDYPESPVSDFEFEEDADGNVTLRAYNGSDEVVVVPSSYEGKPVTYIGTLSFANDCPVKAVKLPDSVLVIEEGSFTNNANIELAMFGNKTEEVGKYAFGNCAVLTEVVLNEGLKKLEEGVFSACPKLKEIEVPDSVEEMEPSSFGVQNGVIICASKGSAAEKLVDDYGKEYGLTFEEK